MANDPRTGAGSGRPQRDGRRLGRDEVERVLELVAAAFPEEEPPLHRVYLFDRLELGELRWRFMIVTRGPREQRLELAAFSCALDERGALSRKLESRKASIPPERLGEVIEALLYRFDEPDCGDYRLIELAEVAGGKPAQLGQLRLELGGEEPADGRDTEQTAGDGHLPPGESDPQRGSLVAG